jgi:hypothetical protein
MISLRPKILLAGTGNFSLALLLRLKNTYGNIDGVAVYGELIDLKGWLTDQGHLESS